MDNLPPAGGDDVGKGPPTNVVYTYTGKRIALYIGNLTWWTTDEDLTDAIRSVGINDVLEIKFFENRANGQSKGFALVCVGSEASSRKLMDLLSKRELHGQNPIVTPCNKQSLSQFEMQSRKTTQSGQMSGEGKAGPPGASSRAAFALGGRGRGRFPGPPGPGGDRFPGPPGPGGPPPPFPEMCGERALPQDRPFILNPKMSPPCFGGATLYGAKVPVVIVVFLSLGSGLRPPQLISHKNGPPFLWSQELTPSFKLLVGWCMPSSDSRGPPPSDPYGRPPPYDRDYGPAGREMDAARTPLSEAEFEEIMNRNRAISSSAISRAVSDASAADYGSAIETLVTAISLIKQSKVSADDRCKVLISSLQDCLHGIESKSYGSGSRRRERSRERDHSRSREKSRRHKSRSRDRHDDYYRERSRERERHRDRDRDRDRERDREREYRHR
ncbi:CPSF6 factor, partial [Amia calva]|nr:CPSF6 factor [Amia calva]